MRETKTALLDFAEQAARASGFDGFSYADLAEAVGVRKASIHYYFPKKSDLSLAIMERYCGRLSSACQEIVDQNEKASDQLLALIALYRDASNNGQQLCLCVSFTTSHQSLSDDVNNQITQFRKMMNESVSSENRNSLTCLFCYSLLDASQT